MSKNELWVVKGEWLCQRNNKYKRPLKQAMTVVVAYLFMGIAKAEGTKYFGTAYLREKTAAW